MANYKCISCETVTKVEVGDAEPVCCPHCGEGGSEPMHVAGRSGRWWKAPGRPALHGTPMTPAQRQAKRRNQREMELHLAQETLDGMEELVNCSMGVDHKAAAALRLSIQALRGTLAALR